MLNPYPREGARAQCKYAYLPFEGQWLTWKPTYPLPVGNLPPPPRNAYSKYFLICFFFQLKPINYCEETKSPLL